MIQRYLQNSTAEVQVPLFQGRNSGPRRGIHTSQVRLYRDGAMADIRELLKQVGVQLGYDGSKRSKSFKTYEWDLMNQNGWHMAQVDISGILTGM